MQLAVAAAERLAAEGVKARLVSMPCWELFDLQADTYRDEVLSPNVKTRLAVEAGSPMGWHKYVGDHGDIVGLERFGASAPAEIVMRELGFTSENVLMRAKALLGRM